MRNPTTKEIMDKCPELIEKSTIPTKNPGGRPRTGRGAKWHKEEDRIRAATVYAVTGNALRTSEITGIPAGTIRQWKTQEWWPQVIERIHQEKDDEFDVKFTEIVDNTVKEINDRMEKGDYIYDIKRGELVRKPMGGKELAVVTSIFVDKRELLRGKRKVHQDQQSIKDKLNSIADMLRKAGLDTKVVEGEVIQDAESTGSETQETSGSEGI